MKKLLWNLGLPCLTVCMLISPAKSLLAQGTELGSNENPYQVPEAISSIDVDGILDEDAWGSALKIELNYEISPRENVEPTVETKVLLVYDRSHLYIGFKCFDPDPSRIQAFFSDRDEISFDDWVAVELDTYNDQRRTFTLFSNPKGVQTDGLGNAAGVKDYNWDTIYSSAGTITSWGYSVEMAIPFSSLRFQRSNGDQIWGLNAVRGYPRSVSHQIWARPYDRSQSCRVCQFLKIQGFRGVSPGRNLEINPTLTALQTRSREEFPEGKFSTDRKQLEAGVTARWGVTPNIVSSVTVNPDFSQVEADSAQLDINQPFALFYPEKRPFFNEGSDLFNSPLNMVHTRTLRDPLWGVKLTGKEGANAVGAYVVRDRVTNLIFPGPEGSRATSVLESNTSSVIRYNRDFWGDSNIGVLVTDREGEDYFNRVYGLDGLLRLTPSDQFRFQALGSSTQYPEEISNSNDQPLGEFGDRAVFLEYAHFTRRFAGDLTYTEIGDDFRADLGFLPQVGYRSLSSNPSYRWVPEKTGWWSSFMLAGGFSYSKALDGTPLRTTYSSSFTYGGPKNSVLQSGYTRLSQRYNGQDFDLDQFRFVGSIWPTKSSRVLFSSQFGDRIDFTNTRSGRGVRLAPTFQINLGAHLRFIQSHIFERMEVSGDRLYTANISETTLTYFLSARTSFRALLQYFDYDYNVKNYEIPVMPEFRQFFSQLRFSYKINPRTVLFLGYTDNYLGDHLAGLTKKDYTVFAKIGYAWVP
ncbi:MAG: carbohydrate binding family 9 domain-containing protein [Acidobacteriota bacterium]|nr:MAG: carbohydrate binding family 9 domain-containing protein [Acidobacteriota bacterium]